MIFAPRLDSAIRQVKRERRARVVTLSLARLLTGGGAGYSAAVYGSSLVPPSYRVAVFSVLLLIGLAGGGVAAFRVFRSGRPRLGDAEAASILAGNDPGSANVLVAGADLSKWSEEETKKRGADPELVRSAVEAADASSPNRALGKVGPALSGDLKLAGLVVVSIVLAALLGPSTDAQTVAQLVSGYSGKPITVGNLTVTIRPPAYTGLPVTVEEGGVGDVRAYPGTLVQLSGVLSEPVDGGTFVGPGKVDIPIEISGSGFKVEWPALKSGMYSLKFSIKGVQLPVDFERRQVVLLADGLPEVELLEPVGDVEAMNVEEIRVAWRAADDFGIEGATLLLSGKTEVRIPLKFAFGKSAAGEARFLPAAYPKLGDGAYLSVEIRDNDTISGPKTGVSRSVYLTFNSTRKLAEELSGLEERLMEAMILLLADHLENPAPDEKLLTGLKESSKNLLTLLEALTRAASRAQAQELSRPEAVTNIAAALNLAIEGWLSDPYARRGELIAELERDIIFLDRLQREMRMEEALSLGEELSMLQRDLFDRLARGEDEKALLEAVNRIEKTLAEIGKKLADRQSLPDDFANADATRDPPKDALSSMLAELKEALRNGDRKKAAELAEQILKELDKWMQNLQKAADGEMDSADSKMSAMLDELMQKVSTAIAEQERIMGETQKTGDELGRRAIEQLKQRMEDFLNRQRARLDQISQKQREMEGFALKGSTLQPNTPEWALEAGKLNAERSRLDQSLRQTRAALEESLSKAAREAKNLEERIRAFEEAAKGYAGEQGAQEKVDEIGERAAGIAREIGEEIEGLLGKRKELATEKERRDLARQGSEESKLAMDIKKIGEQLQKMSEESPFIKPGAGAKAGEAGKSAGSAGKSLGEGDPYGAVPNELATLEKLTELGGELESMKQSMGSGKEGGRGRGSRKRPGQRGGEGEVDRSRVDIPGEAESAQLRKLREEVMKTMGEGRYPKDYQMEIRRYFEGLIK